MKKEAFALQHEENSLQLFWRPKSKTFKQAMQVVVQNKLISVALKPDGQTFKVPLFARLVNAVPWLQGLTARFIAVGVRPEHVHSPEAKVGKIGKSLNRE